MSIFYAELQVLSRQVPCTQVTFAFRQTVDQWGRPSSTVRIERLKVTLTGEPVGWNLWEALKFDESRRVSGWVLYFDGQGHTARRYAFYDAALVSLEFRHDGRGTSSRQAATEVELHFGPATVDVDGQRIEAYSRIPWKTTPQTSFRALTKPPDPEPSAHLAALLATAKLKTEEIGTGLLKKVLTPAGEVATEFLGVGLAAIARTASLTAGLLLTPTNSRDDPGYAAEWELYRRNHQHGTPLTPAQLRLAQLERLHEQGSLTPDEEAEMIALLAKVKGIRVGSLADLDVTGRYKKQPQVLPGFHFEEITYTKRSKADTDALRRKFDSSVRAKFMKKISSDPVYEHQLRKAGFDDKAFKIMQDGNVPKDWQVHHKLPLDDGGDNSFGNLLLIKTTPYHSVVTGYQKTNTGKLAPGDSAQVKWPTYSQGIVYPPQKP